MTEIDEGDSAPAFEAEDEAGRTWTLDELTGRPFVLYFYPRDDTPGCTTEACSFQDAMPDFQALEVPVLGVSDDDAASHRSFKDEHGLEFPLLVDEEGELADAYGVWVEKQMFGNTFHGNERVTFLVDGEGTVARVWEDVEPEGHGEEVLAAVRELADADR